MPSDRRSDRFGVARNRHSDASPRRRERLRPDVLAAIAAAVVIVLVASVLAVILGTETEREKYVVESTAALDFMDTSIHTGALIGGQYALEPAASFVTENRAVRVTTEPGAEAATATLPEVFARDVVSSAAFTFVDAEDTSVSAFLHSRGTEAGDYRAGVTLDAGRRPELAIFRTGAEAEKLMWAVLPFDVTGADRIIVEFRVVGTKEVQLRARAWVDSAAAEVSEIAVTDQGVALHPADGSVGFDVTVPTNEAAAASVVVDDLRAFSLVPVTVRVAGAAATPAPSHDGPSGDGVARENAGAAAPGTTRYPMPSGAIVVAPDGIAGAPGTIEEPLSSVTEAITRATPGGTIVLRAGNYHEHITIPESSHLSIQSAPGEEVWFDGSVVVDRWEKAGDVWISSDWTTRFDSSPTYTSGAPDGETPGWQFVNPDKPMAAHPDQVWIDGRAQTQVGSLDEVVHGTFFVDYESQTLTIGTDPHGRVVRASDLARAIDLRTTDATLRGFGVRRYSPSVPHLGAVRAEAASARIENVSIVDSATTGLFVRDPHSRIRHVTVARSGMLGIAVSYADDLVLNSVVSVDNNTEGFNTSPVSGGVKITRSRSVRVVDGVFDSNGGHGLWFDESTFDGIAAGNEISGNAGHGLIMEISSSFVVVNNIVAGNAQNGIKLNNTSNVEVWNNTLVGNGRTINIVQDSRRARDQDTPGHDPRQPFPDPTMSWIISSVTVRNNVMADSTGKCLLCIEDYSKEYTAEQLGVTADANLYQRTDAATPSWAVVWSKGSEVNPAVFTSVAAFRSATGQEKGGREVTGDVVATPTGTLTDTVRSLEDATAIPLPEQIAKIASVRLGLSVLGAWRTPTGQAG